MNPEALFTKLCDILDSVLAALAMGGQVEYTKRTVGGQRRVLDFVIGGVPFYIAMGPVPEDLPERVVDDVAANPPVGVNDRKSAADPDPSGG